MKAILTVDGEEFEANTHDISLNGALLTLVCKDITLAGKPGVLSLQLDDFDAKIMMNITVIHQEEAEIGVQCHDIDIDSVCFLRRLIELNLGDDGQLHKELSQLTRD
jgi:hypothetical protein